MNQNNDKEFENLFKRAAEQYPLDTDTANWDAVLNKLEESDKKKPFFLFTKRTGFTILLIVLVGFISSLVTGIIVWKNTNNNNIKNSRTENQQSKTAIPSNNHQEELNSKSQSESTIKVEKKIAEEVYNKVIDQLNNPSQQSRKQPASLAKKESRSIHQKNGQHQSAITLNEAKPTGLQLINATITQTKENDNNRLHSEAAVQNKAFTNNNNTNATVNIIADSTNKKLTTNSVKSTDTSSASTTKQSEKKKEQLGNKYFYAGLLYARDKSTIGFEPNKGRGYSYQLLIGYRLNQRLSFETGVHIEKKELYTTNDTYYKKVLNPVGTVLWIESESKLIEIPLTVKYDMLNSKKHNIFGSLGISSYITNSEHLEYEEELNGVTTSEYLALEKKTSDLFASTNFSLGYQYTLGKKLHCRIEPYINLPIKGIGKGETPIVSKGIYIGLIYQFQNKLLKQ